MADLASITGVQLTDDTQTRFVQYGATIAPGQSVVMVDGKALLVDADLSAERAGMTGIAISPGVEDGYGLIAVGGSVILVGTTMAVGTVYLASGTAGGLKPHVDATTGDWITVAGVASSATQLKLSIVASGIQKP